MSRVVEHDTCSLSCPSNMTDANCTRRACKYFGQNYRNGKITQLRSDTLNERWFCGLDVNFHLRYTPSQRVARERANFVNTLRKQWDHSDQIDIHIRWIWSFSGRETSQSFYGIFAFECKWNRYKKNKICVTPTRCSHLVFIFMSSIFHNLTQISRLRPFNVRQEFEKCIGASSESIPITLNQDFDLWWLYA